MVLILSIFGILSALLGLYGLYGLLNPMLSGASSEVRTAFVGVTLAGVFGAFVQSALCFGVSEVLERLRRR